MLNLLLIFVIYAFLGWILEIVFHAFNHGKFTNRGFLNGPYCPIYGFSLVLIHLFLYDKNINPLLIIIYSSTIISLLELVGGYLMDKIFKQRWWDYSKQPFNIGGYVCLKFSITWGLGSLIVVDYLHPIIMKLINLINPKIGLVIVIIFLIIMIFDFVYIILDLLKFNRHLRQVDEIIVKMNTVSNTIGNMIAKKTILTNQKLKSYKKELAKLTKEKEQQIKDIYEKNKNILNKFPNYKNLKYNNIIEEIRKKFKTK